MAKREVFGKTTKVLYSVPKEKGRENTFIPKDQRTKQRDELEPVVQERREWLSRHWKKPSLKLRQLRRRHGHTAGGAVTSGKKVAGKNAENGKMDEQCPACNSKPLLTL